MNRAEKSGNGIRKVFTNLFVLFLYFFSTVLGNIILFGEQEKIHIRWYEWFYLWSTIPIIAILLVGGMYLIAKMSEIAQDTKLPTSQSAKIFKEGVSNWYNKWCTKIDWK